MLQQGCFTCVHKYYTVEQWVKFASEHPEVLPYVACSAGTAEGDFENMSNVLETCGRKKYKYPCTCCTIFPILYMYFAVCRKFSSSA